MQQHPVPRDIIGFRFKLIGEMTIRQFAYLAGGIVSGYVFFRVLPGVFGVAVGILAAGSGAALAFVPLQGRPLDTWIKAYFKSVYSPTQFVWKKQNPPPTILARQIKNKHGRKNKPLSSQERSVKTDKQLSRKHYEEVEKKLGSYLKTVKKKPHENLDQAEQNALKQTNMAMAMQTTGNGKLKTASAPSDVKNIVDEKEIKKPKGQDHSLQKAEISGRTSSVSSAASQTEDKIREKVKKELEQQYKAELERLKREKEQIEQKIHKLATPPPDKMETTPAPEDQSHLRILSQQEATEAGLPLRTKQPNVVVGTTTDPHEQQLPDIIVTIKNKDGRIVRALKTNNLGQFVSLTPLPNGEYFLKAEDPSGNYKFDIIRIGLHGKTFPPISIIARAKKENKQEEIRKKLFNRQADAN